MSASLYEMTKKIWQSEGCEDLSARWAEELGEARSAAEQLPRFNQWGPLRVYTSLTKARRPEPVFSVRYQGQEVACIRVGTTPRLVITKTHETNNSRCFGLQTRQGCHEWNAKEAAAFRKMFNGLSCSSMKSEEAWLQSDIFKKMMTHADGGFHACQPVLFVRFPFQCPVPISASRGSPKASKGNLDILARRGQGGTHLAIWELKRPGACGTALEQVYIYGVTLALMLRGRSGDHWYKCMGFNRVLNPDRELRIDLIIALTKDRERELVRHLKRFDEPLALSAERTKLSLHFALYEWNREKGRIRIDEPIPLIL